MSGWRTLLELCSAKRRQACLRCWAATRDRRSLVFCFSSRRRHTRSLCDWSSDCALPILKTDFGGQPNHRHGIVTGHKNKQRDRRLNDRSEERRVGKECRYRWSPYHYKKKIKYKWEVGKCKNNKKKTAKKKKEKQRQ